jgi:hypothetical protein
MAQAPQDAHGVACQRRLRRVRHPEPSPLRVDGRWPTRACPPPSMASRMYMEQATMLRAGAGSIGAISLVFQNLFTNL